MPLIRARAIKRCGSPGSDNDDCTALERERYPLLLALKRSTIYRELRGRLAGPQPVQPTESWVEGQLFYFVFDLIPDHRDALLPGMALFIFDRGQQDLLLVRLIQPDQAGTEAQITTIYQREGAEDGASGREQRDSEQLPGNNEIVNNYQGAPGLSRRSFLKRIGAVALGAVATSALTPADIQAASAANKRNFKQALTIALGSPLYAQAVDELSKKGFRVDASRSLDTTRLLSSEQYPERVGLVFNAIGRPADPGSAADIIMTVDLTAQKVYAAHYAVYLEQNNLPTKTSVTLYADGARSEDTQTIQPTSTLSGQLALKTQGYTAASCGNWYYHSCHMYGECYGIFRCIVDKLWTNCSGSVVYDYRYTC
jgi:hypothetical protein